jgi:undecaprenyl diphosphate synthase
MKYLVHYLKTETSRAQQEQRPPRGHRPDLPLPEAVQDHTEKAIATLSRNNGLTLIKALRYGGRTEIVEAARRIGAEIKAGNWTRRTSTNRSSPTPLHPQLPDPDLLIRTSRNAGEQLPPVQISYAELVVTPTLWPDFRKPNSTPPSRNTRDATAASGYLSRPMPNPVPSRRLPPDTVECPAVFRIQAGSNSRPVCLRR